MVYLIKLTQQKDANLILTRKCSAIATKLSSLARMLHNMMNS